MTILHSWMRALAPQRGRKPLVSEISCRNSYFIIFYCHWILGKQPLKMINWPRQKRPISHQYAILKQNLMTIRNHFDLAWRHPRLHRFFLPQHVLPCLEFLTYDGIKDQRSYLRGELQSVAFLLRSQSDLPCLAPLLLGAEISKNHTDNTRISKWIIKLTFSSSFVPRTRHPETKDKIRFEERREKSRFEIWYHR